MLVPDWDAEGAGRETLEDGLVDGVTRGVVLGIRVVAPAVPGAVLPATAGEELPAAGPPPGWFVGGATAVLGSSRAPMPQGMAAPSGWVGLGASSTVPSAAAMVNRVVHIGILDVAEVNW